MAFTYSGKLYRALNPVYAHEPMSGRGAERYGGRFKPKGIPALYASTSVLTALRGANQVGDLQPTTLVGYRARIEMVFDTGDAAALGAAGIDEAALADPTWRDQMRTGTMDCSFEASRRASVRATGTWSCGNGPNSVRPVLS